ncbi:hypothetical protein RHIZ404_201082 [Rhizobium sp. EC-SD404]|nr:hypothetical protein RHIZ404_201082 [Rhizobium sp. EC-SD404]
MRKRKKLSLANLKEFNQSSYCSDPSRTKERCVPETQESSGRKDLTLLLKSIGNRDNTKTFPFITDRDRRMPHACSGVVQAWPHATQRAAEQGTA